MDSHLECASKGCQCGLQNLPILIESQETFDSVPDMFCLHSIWKSTLRVKTLRARISRVRTTQ